MCHVAGNGDGRLHPPAAFFTPVQAPVCIVPCLLSLTVVYAAQYGPDCEEKLEAPNHAPRSLHGLRSPR